MGQQDEIISLQRGGLNDLLEEGVHRLLILQGGVTQSHEQTVLLTVDHLLGVKGQVDQIFAQASAEGALEDGEKGVGLLLGHHGERLVEAGDDLLIFIHIAAADMGDIALVLAKAAANFGNFFFVHREPSFYLSSVNGMRQRR